ncbi:hypothetical protein AWB74_03303 [Caballeronia arvi]|uniref:Uncharacterized protein n=1 Tax=Caballeronia arvi TaxID=1777135 RepID=A0A158J428_9BURK|nr:hypothetical protein AWB74_03303 [Caballeronia arvi]
MQPKRYCTNCFSCQTVSHSNPKASRVGAWIEMRRRYRCPYHGQGAMEFGPDRQHSRCRLNAIRHLQKELIPGHFPRATKSVT